MISAHLEASDGVSCPDGLKGNTQGAVKTNTNRIEIMKGRSCDADLSKTLFLFTSVKFSS